MSHTRDHQSPAAQAGNALLDAKDLEIRSLQETIRNREKRIDELLEDRCTQSFEDVIAEYRKGCSNGAAGECPDCTEGFIRALREAHAKRVSELLEANNRFEQNGRLAKRFAVFVSAVILDNTLGPTRREMGTILVKEYRKDNPRT